MMSTRTLLLALSLSVPSSAALAADTPPPPPAGLPFNAFLTEDELRLLFDYTREAIIAAMKGETYRMPPELAHALERARERLMREGNAAVRQMMEMIQKDLDRALEEMKPPAPAPVPERTRY